MVKFMMKRRKYKVQKHPLGPRAYCFFFYDFSRKKITMETSILIKVFTGLHIAMNFCVNEQYNFLNLIEQRRSKLKKGKKGISVYFAISYEFQENAFD